MEQDTVTPELLAPAGSFDSAVYAFRSGADAVYFGLPRFSARKNAVNLTFDQVAKLKRLAVQEGKKVYIALNTVIAERELDELSGFLVELNRIKPDGIIIQDFGLLSLLRAFFPGLPIHASTQMAAYTPDAVRFLGEQGITRVILSREATLEDINAIRTANPEMELEVFAHGALCYGFSGLCLASQYLCGRSANRGECAQICRGTFQGKNRDGYFFSCNDLALLEDVKKLKSLGINAFKIEGRMKSPEYTGTTVALYRAILDGADEKTLREHSRLSSLAFSRKRTKGFFFTKHGDDLINIAYPSHLGLPLGRILKTNGKNIFIELSEPIMVKDGVLALSWKNRGSAMNFGVESLTLEGKKVFEARRGDKVWIPFPQVPGEGTLVYKTSSEKVRWPGIRDSSFKAYQTDLVMDAVLRDGAIAFTVFSGNAMLDLTETYPVSPVHAEKKEDFPAILEKIFAESKDSRFRIHKIHFTNQSRLPDNSIFIRPSVLKSIKNDFYQNLDHAYLKAKTEKMARINAFPEADGDEIIPAAHVRRTQIIPRQFDPIPFVADMAGLVLESIACIDGYHFLPLPPVIWEPRIYMNSLRVFLSSFPDRRFCLGLNNVAHLAWIQELEGFMNVSFYVDYGLYCANRFTYAYFNSLIPSLRFLFFWIEGTQEDFTALEAGRGALLRIEPDFQPPLFLSRVCTLRHTLERECSGCQGHYEEEIRQNKNKFLLLVSDCITYLFQK